MADEDVTREIHRSVVLQLVDAVSRRDLPKLMALVHDDLTMEFPFHATLRGVVDKSQLEQMCRYVFDLFETYEMSRVEFYDLVDPNQLIAEYHGSCHSKVGDVVYRNHYVCFFTFEDRLVKDWREFVDPLEWERVAKELASQS